jgi:integrase
VPNARYGKGKRWLACWQDPDGGEPTKAFTKKRDADLYWQKMETDAARGEYFDPKAGEETFGSVEQRWLASRVVDPATKIRYESVARLHVDPTLGKRTVNKIKPSDVQTFQAKLGERFGPSTVAAARLIVVGVLDLAVEDDLIKKNPARSRIVKKVTPGNGERIQAWGDEKVYPLIDAHPPALRAMPLVGATAGLREGELFGLAMEDIDFDELVIHVRRQLKKLGGQYVFALPKNDRERLVPIAAWVADSLRVHIANHRPAPCTLPWERVDGKPRTHTLLFQWIHGGHMKPRNYSETVWKPALAACGIIAAPVKDKRKRKRFVTTRREGTHQLRHHYASVMLTNGVNVKELAEYLGHADPGFTLRIYAHLLPDSHERARQAIDKNRRRLHVVR